MVTKLVKIDPANIDSVKIKEAATLVDAGGLAAFPTETVYGIACRVEASSLAKLDILKSRDADKHYTLHIGKTSDVGKYVPTVGLRAKKLVEKAWPGPLTIVFKLEQNDVDKQQRNFSREVFELLYKDNTIGIRCPVNPIALMLLQQVKNPVVAPSANIAGQTPATDAEQVLARFSGRIELLLDGGPCKYKKSSTVVKVSGNALEVLRSGVYSQAELETLSAVKFLFVCTGNTCRSPMAVGIFRKYLAKKLKRKVDDFNKIGYKVFSAGTMGITGSPASAEAIAACAAKGISIKAHKSRALSLELIEESDFIYAMGRVHCERVVNLCPESKNKCVLLAENEEIPDPIGQPQESYNNCADLIEQAIKKRMSELVL